MPHHTRFMKDIYILLLLGRQEAVGFKDSWWLGGGSDELWKSSLSLYRVLSAAVALSGVVTAALVPDLFRVSITVMKHPDQHQSRDGTTNH